MVRRAAPTAARSINSKLVPLSTDTNGPVVVIAPQWVGDAILSLPLIDQLAQTHSAVDVIALTTVQAVYRCSTSVRSVIAVNFKRGALELQKRRAIAAQCRDRYAAAVILPNSFKSALIPWLARIPVRRGMAGEMRHLLLTDRREPPIQDSGRRPSMLEHYLRLADDAIHTNIDPMGRHRPKMAINTATTNGALGHHGLNNNALENFLSCRILAICPGAEYGPAKQWPAASFAAVANNWIKSNDLHRVVILGSNADTATGQMLMKDLHDQSRALNLCGKTELLEAFAWIARSALVVSNDSGLMHAAAALDIPVVGVYGSSDPRHTPPHNNRAAAVSLHLSCSPCFKRVCPLGTTACLNTLQPEQVTATINGLVSGARAAPREAVHASP